MLKNRPKQNKQIASKKANQSVNKTSKGTSSAGSGFYYSFLTVVLIICLIQIMVSAVLNISKIISYQAKIVQITKTRDAANALNEQLKDSIKNFSNATGVEAIARNNLKMSGEDEVLVIINSNEDSENNEKPQNVFSQIFGSKKENQ